MAINLLGSMTVNPLANKAANQANQAASSGGQPYTPNNSSGVGGMNVAPKMSVVPMGFTAKTPTASVTPAPTTLPKTQQNPVTTSAQTNSLPPAPVAPISQQNTTPNPASNPTYNQYTGTTAGTPTQGTNTPTVIGANGQANNGLLSQAAQSSPTFNSTTGALVNAGQQGSPAAQGYTAQTAQYGAGNIPIGQQAANIASQYGQQIANVGGKGAQFESGQLTTGTSPVAEGNAAVTAQTTAAQQNALAQGENAALLGTGQQLTAQNQAAGAANEAAGQSYTGQGLQQGALQQAASLMQPALGQPGQAYYNPQTGGAIGGSQGVPAGIDPGVWSQYQQDYATGNFGAIPASITGNAQLYGQLQQSAPPGFNYNTALGQAQGQQTLGAAGGTAAAGNIVTSSEAAGGVSAGQTQQIANYQSAQQQGQNLISQAKDLISTFGLNPSELNAANGAVQKIAQNTSSPQYQELSNYLNDIAARYAQILTPPGGSATDSTRAIAASMLNSTAQGTSLEQVMDSLDQQASAVISGVRTNTPTSQASNSGTTVPTTSSTGAGGGWASLGD